MTRKSGLISLSLLAFAACGDGATDPSDETVPTLNADVATAVADGVGEDVADHAGPEPRPSHRSLMFLPVGSLDARSVPSTAPPGGTNAQSRDGGSAHHRATYAFYNAGGTAQQETFDANSTASIRVKRAVDGSMDAGHRRGLDRRRDPSRSRPHRVGPRRRRDPADLERYRSQRHLPHPGHRQPRLPHLPDVSRRDRRRTWWSRIPATTTATPGRSPARSRRMCTGR